MALQTFTDDISKLRQASHQVFRCLCAIHIVFHFLLPNYYRIESPASQDAESSTPGHVQSVLPIHTQGPETAEPQTSTYRPDISAWSKYLDSCILEWQVTFAIACSFVASVVSSCSSIQIGSSSLIFSTIPAILQVRGLADPLLRYFAFAAISQGLFGLIFSSIMTVYFRRGDKRTTKYAAIWFKVCEPFMASPPPLYRFTGCQHKLVGLMDHIITPGIYDTMVR